MGRSSQRPTGTHGRREFLAGSLAFACVTSGCSRPSRPLVFAASSLGPVLQALLHAFGRGADLELAGSQVLRAQIELGARPDLFFAANADALTRLEGAGLVASRREFATTELVLATRSKWLAKRPELDRLCELEARWVLASADSPLGGYTDALLDDLSLSGCISKRVLSRDPSASASLGRLRSGDADITVTYRSLVSAAAPASDISVFDLPAHGRPRPRYLLAQLKDATHAEFAQAFDVFLDSDAAQQIYPQFGMRGS